MTLAQIERIERATLIAAASKSRQARRERLHQQMFIGTLAVGILFVVVALWMIASSGIEIGPQTEIYQAYKAQQHKAEEFPSTGGIATR